MKSLLAHDFGSTPGAASETPRKRFKFMASHPDVEGFYDAVTGTVSYVVSDPATSICAIIDPVCDYDPRAARTSDVSVKRLIDYVQALRLDVAWILETHAHADHLSGAQMVKRALGGQTVIGEHICSVQSRFKATYNLGAEFEADGSQFDRLVADHDQIKLGEMNIDVLHTPGHTPACVSYVIGDAVFVGDTLFMPDYGTARADFPGGDARMLYRSIRKLFALPSATRMFMCHDYRPRGRPAAWETTVDEQRRDNEFAREGIDEDSFVRWREERDAALDVPALLWPSVQVNIRAGHLPKSEDNGIVYLKTPLNLLGGGH